MQPAQRVSDTKYNRQSTYLLEQLLQDGGEFHNKVDEIKSLLESGATPYVDFKNTDGQTWTSLLDKAIEYTRQTRTSLMPIDFTEEKAVELVDLLMQKGIHPSMVPSRIISKIAQH